MTLTTPIEEVPLIGPVSAKKLAKLDIYTLEDLLYHIPARHEDTSNVLPIGNVINGSTEQIYTVKGTIVEIKNIFTRNGKRLTQAVIEDESGIAEIIWFNQHFLTRTIKEGTEILISGKVSFENFLRPKFISPSYELVKGDIS